MLTLEELRNKLGEAVDKRSEMLTLVETENREFTEQEQADYDALKTECDETKAAITKLETKLDEIEELNKLKEDLDKPVRKITINHNVPGRAADNTEEFRSLGEFMHSVRFDQDDVRLRDTWTDGPAETREQTMGVGAEGGFMVPQQWSSEIMSVTPQEAIVRPRARVIPAGTPPDAAFTLQALNQSADENIYGGMEFSWIGEGQTKPETDAKLKDVSWTPHELAGHVVVTDKLLRNWTAASSFLTDLMRQGTAAAQDTAFWSGSGVAQPLGVINSPAVLPVARGTATTIVYQDLVNLEQLARETGFTNYIYVGSNTIKSQLYTMVDPGTAGTLIWRRDAVGPNPNTLMGRPFIFNERSPILGAFGDLALVDLSEYVIKDGSGPFVAASEHVHFTKNKTVIKIFMNTDGHPWLDAPLTLEGSTANLVSPFVILDVP